jgi:hypothetical protein
MTTIRKPSAFSAVVAVGVLLLQCCACTFTGKPQKIPVTSNPAGAKIFADGEEMGIAPLNLSLKRSEDHTIRIEKPGYNPVEIRLLSQSPHGGGIPSYVIVLLGVPIGGFVGGTLGLALTPQDKEDDYSGLGKGFLIGAVLTSIVGLVSIKQSKRPFLSPAVLRVTLEKAQEQARTDVVVINSEQWESIRWIRISCSEGGTEGFITVN